MRSTTIAFVFAAGLTACSAAPNGATSNASPAFNASHLNGKLANLASTCKPGSLSGRYRPIDTSAPNVQFTVYRDGVAYLERGDDRGDSQRNHGCYLEDADGTYRFHTWYPDYRNGDDSIRDYSFGVNGRRLIITAGGAKATLFLAQ